MPITTTKTAQEDRLNLLEHTSSLQQELINEQSEKISKLEHSKKVEDYIDLATKIIYVALLGLYFSRVGWKKIINDKFLSCIMLFKIIA